MSMPRILRSNTNGANIDARDARAHDAPPIGAQNEPLANQEAPNGRQNVPGNNANDALIPDKRRGKWDRSFLSPFNKHEIAVWINTTD